MSTNLPSCRAVRFAELRRGQSLVELLMSLAIIGILMALIFSAVMSVMGTTRRAGARVSQQTIDLAVMSDSPLHVPAPPPRPGRMDYVPDRYLMEFPPSANAQAEADKLAGAAASMTPIPT